MDEVEQPLYDVAEHRVVRRGAGHLTAFTGRPLAHQVLQNKHTHDRCQYNTDLKSILHTQSGTGVKDVFYDSSCKHISLIQTVISGSKHLACMYFIPNILLRF